MDLGRQGVADAAQTQIGNVLVVPDVKFVMMKSSIDRLKASRAAAMMPGQDEREGHLPERRPLVGAEVHRRLLEVAGEALHPRPHGHDHEADVEHDVGDQDRLDPSGKREPPVSVWPAARCAVATNSVSRLAPRTISGVAIGRKMNLFVATRPRNW